MQRWIWTLLEYEVNLCMLHFTFTADVSVMCCLILLFYNDTKVWSFLLRSLVFKNYIHYYIHTLYSILIFNTYQNVANKIKNSHNNNFRFSQSVRVGVNSSFHVFPNCVFSRQLCVVGGIIGWLFENCKPLRAALLWVLQPQALFCNSL